MPVLQFLLKRQILVNNQISKHPTLPEKVRVQTIQKQLPATDAL
jgi:hypothetical protein